LKGAMMKIKELAATYYTVERTILHEKEELAKRKLHIKLEKMSINPSF